jgi:predicted O-methyltransferase YrrM
MESAVLNTFIVKTVIKSIAYRCAPALARPVDEWRWMRRQADALVARLQHVRDVDQLVEAVCECEAFRPLQNRAEIAALLTRLSAIRPRIICEIGGANGGTLCLFSRMADSAGRLLSIDIAYSTARIAAARRFAGPRQEIECWRTDSQAASTAERVRRWLGEDRIDVLFIDGDHSLNGIQTDYRLYTPLVREGGLIVFHDIVHDWRTRFGIVTSSDVGQVPAFWASLRASGAVTEEIVDDAEQDGFGLGLMIAGVGVRGMAS